MYKTFLGPSVPDMVFRSYSLDELKSVHLTCGSLGRI